jgi:hypothetical protein
MGSFGFEKLRKVPGKSPSKFGDPGGLKGRLSKLMMASKFGKGGMMGGKMDGMMGKMKMGKMGGM